MINIDNSSWKEFLITDLFELCSVKTKLTKQDLCEDGSIPVYSSETSNNGINGYTNMSPQFIADENTPLYLVFGDHTRAMNVADKSFCVMDNVKVLKPRYYMSVEILLYISTIWKKAIPNLGYSRHWKVAKNQVIFLPITSSKKIDWEYMTRYIAMLEKEKFTMLEQFLIAAELKNCELTEKDKQILSTNLINKDSLKRQFSRNISLKEAKLFRIADLFEVKTPIKKFNANTLKITDGIGYPYVVRSSTNNGIKGFIDEDPCYLNEGNTFSFGQDTATVFWQEQPYFTGDKIKILKPKFECNYKIAMYIVNGIAKAFSRFSWGVESYEISVIENTEFLLPVTYDNAPDWKYMERYTIAIEKKVINEVINWKNKKETEI